MPAATICRFQAGAATSPAIAAMLGSPAAARAASELLDAATRSTSGWLRVSQPWHCASAWGCAEMVLMPSMLPDCDIRQWRMTSERSPRIFSGVLSSRSRLRFTAPSVEFSTGTIPTSAWPASTARKTSSNDAQGNFCTAWPKCSSAACSENEPCGPRNATVMPRSRPRQAEMISVQTDATPAFGNGPGLSCCRRRITSASRSGRSTGPSAWAACLTSPTSSAARARCDNRSRIWASKASMR
ncbi:hypothetical protein D3C86_862760 [compost metagenome]